MNIKTIAAATALTVSALTAAAPITSAAPASMTAAPSMSVVATSPIAASPIAAGSTAATPRRIPVKIWADGRFRPGRTLWVNAYAGADRKGTPYDRATVVGPRGIKGTLRPAADAGYLTGSVRIPARLTGSWIRLTLITPDGHRASTIVRRG